MRNALACVLALSVAFAARAADNMFDVGKKPAEKAYVTLAPELPVLTGPQSAMTRRLAGVLAELDGAGVRQLKAAVGVGAPADDFGEGARRVCIVQLFAGASGKSVEILRSQAGTIAARELEEHAGAESPRPGALVGLDEEKFLPLSAAWGAFRGRFDAAPANGSKPIEAGAVVQLDKPYTAGWLPFNKETLARRFLRGRQTAIDGATRPLGENAIWIRLPRGYAAARPAGLLVWVSAGYLGQPPEALHSACDELGLVCVGPAGAGNDRDLGNRCQLIFDAMATACERFHIDQRRVYATGISGGGKISSMMWACFPDVFAGAVPIVGLACYENMPIGNGQMWPGNFDKPGARLWPLLRSRRAGAITGNKDFNYEPMHAALRVFNRDGLVVRMFVHQGMGHEMPSPEGFTEAMSWVDEPYRAVRSAEETKAAAALEKLKREHPLPKDDAAQRKRLVELTANGPWSPAAWEAVEMLGASGR